MGAKVKVGKRRLKNETLKSDWERCSLVWPRKNPCFWLAKGIN